MNAIKKDSIIKSLDFPGRTDCFIVATVLEVCDGYYKVRSNLRVVEGRVSDNGVGYLFEVPFEGQALIDGPDRLTLLCSPAEGE